ncbi:hypothetical protein SBOR_6878 [Sclerotinia borealis F-4128]|uniref:J domain-containing protein n=1 Tax=Sclerotinia borealis (strain F-4128) TaxID=1432307 RepID=W9CA87_SCLBF|nr:hypothetical protein SBOR_6878 [Sclerotinia borealis F-4128]
MSDYDLYMTLHVAPSASLAEIKHAYRQLLLAHHLDNNYDDLEATKKFQEIILAYETLSNTLRRAKYDETFYSTVEPHIENRKSNNRRNKGSRARVTVTASREARCDTSAKAKFHAKIKTHCKTRSAATIKEKSK